MGYFALVVPMSVWGRALWEKLIMAGQGNCFHLYGENGTVKFRRYFILSNPKLQQRRMVVALRCGDAYEEIQALDSVLDMEGKQEVVRWADYDLIDRCLISPHLEKSVTLIRVDASLDFSFGPRVKPLLPEDATLWIGGETQSDKVAFRQRGHHGNPRKQQFFRVPQRESVYLCGADKTIVRLTAGVMGEKPKLTAVTASEYADYILSEVRLRGEDISVRSWCWYTLQALGCQAEINAFQQLFPGFHARLK